MAKKGKVMTTRERTRQARTQDDGVDEARMKKARQEGSSIFTEYPERGSIFTQYPAPEAPHSRDDAEEKKSGR